ncbi:MAG: hypothetical protein A2X12_02280 [Bacteroidetes bacterium GWE2_29_8]|nr:MAG: hypothetical protein A2X12_02280 [Bacteroidetes bacterium GWE2_29_8]OFY19166.1 MAG: hypothetical protein A2X02_01610 [Bacteroidetes bacterium GWF2_29_10]
MENIYIPENLLNFILVSLFSLIFGLAQKRIVLEYEEKKVFGTDRTFTFIGILGFILYIVDPTHLYLYMGGGFAIILMLALYYYNKLNNLNKYGITTIIIAIITYSLTPLIFTQPKYLVMAIVVTVLLFTEMKTTLFNISQKFDKEEFITLSKFLIIAGVILPILPKESVVSFLSLSPYKIWVAVVVISSISYLSYILRKFVFKDKGIIITGILGGMYSSTASTIILAKKSKNSSHIYHYASAIIFATAMMYIRIFLIMLFFNITLAKVLLLPFVILTIISIASGVVLYIYSKKDEVYFSEKNQHVENDRNPLEFNVAIFFTILFVTFSFITYYTIQYFGTNGLNILSLIVGITDIDPFLINLFQGKFDISISMIAIATLQSIIGNNIIKAIYTLVISGRKVFIPVAIAFLAIIIANIAVIILI